ncbi:uncharacterized protein LOC116927743 [Daphnia magna]|uniref:uncharacterized protein LOC116927743 n=1 Tax=Daphnia magna TaxID=35525 RepID=UPI001E1BB27D|nr:uncharacterized protein LOC116927743 [Daphnia magna]
MITPTVTTVPAPAMTVRASTSSANKSNRLVKEDADILDVLDEENSEFDETDDDWDDIGGDHVVDDRELVERKDEDPHDEEHERHESDIFDQTISLTGILDERFTSENVYVFPPHRRCACHTLNLICKCDIYKNMEPSLKKLFESTDKKFKAIWAKQNRSAKVSDNIRKPLGKLFIINNETRWNSYYNAIKRGKHFINKKRSELKALFEVYGIQYFRPAEEELVREYVKIMKPMSEALDVLQADVKVSIGYLLPTLPFLLKNLRCCLVIGRLSIANPSSE